MPEDVFAESGEDIGVGKKYQRKDSGVRQKRLGMHAT